MSIIGIIAALTALNSSLIHGAPVQQADLSPLHHDKAIEQPLTDYVRVADVNGMVGVDTALFLGRAGIGEFWQYKQGDQTCIGFFYREISKPYMSEVCGDAEDPNKQGFGMTTVVINDEDEAVAQAAWFPGSWDANESTQGAEVRLATADASGLGPDENPLASLFIEDAVLVSTDDHSKAESVDMIRGERLTLRSS